MAPATIPLSHSSPTNDNIPFPSFLLTSPPSHLPTPTQSALISHLQSTSSLPQLADLLTDSLARTGWTERVRALALELLRSGQATTFPEVFHEVVRRAKIQRSDEQSEQVNGMVAKSTGGKVVNGTVPKAKSDNAKGPNGIASQANGQLQHQRAKSMTVILPDGSYGPDGWPDVRIPAATVAIGVEFLNGAVREVVDIVED